MNHLLANWKTSVQSLLTVIIGLPPALSEFTGLIPHKIALYIAVSAAVGKVILGGLQKDAGTVIATPIGSTTPEAMPSTEVPIQAGATVVKES